MNYRHIYHAGNICDVIKHAAFALALGRLRAKEAAFCVVDTHAGCGQYDLEDPRAAKTSEAKEGALRMLASLAAGGWGNIPEGFGEYLDVLKRANPGWDPADTELKGFRRYPGSPVVAAGLLRPQDRLIACELHPEDCAELRRTMRHYAQAQIHCRDGYEALRAFLPPSEKRGLALIDPPYEDAQEFDRLPALLAEAWRRWPQGIFMLWYPIKERPAIWRLHEALRNLCPGGGDGRQSKILCAEFVYQEEIRSDRLNGSGLIAINPPWRLDRQLQEIFSFLHKALATDCSGIHVAWL